jgi:hypothetical protein
MLGNIRCELCTWSANWRVRFLLLLSVVLCPAPHGLADGPGASSAATTSQAAARLSDATDHGQPATAPPWWTVWPPMIVACGAVLGLFVNAWYYRRVLQQNDTEEEVKRLRSVLDSFYGPFQTLKHANRYLYEVLKQGGGVQGGTSGSLFVRLLEGQQFNTNDRQLIELIMENNKELDLLIESKGCLIESPQLFELLCRFRAHHRLILSAFSGTLKGEVDRFRESSYPRDLDATLDQEVERLNLLLNGLRKGR